MFLGFRVVLRIRRRCSRGPQKECLVPTLDFFVVALRKDSNLIQSWIGAVRKTVCSWDAQGYLELHPGTIDGDADGPASEREREKSRWTISQRDAVHPNFTSARFSHSSLFLKR